MAQGWTERKDRQSNVYIQMYAKYTYPLSEVKKTNVLLATPNVLSAAMTSPTAQSRLASESPNGPLSVVLVNCLEAN